MDSKQVFISFSSQNSAEAQRVCNLLESNGHTCFISSRDLIAGKEYAGQLIDNITNSKMVVLLLSKSSNDSPHVLREVEYAVSKKIPILVYLLEAVTLSKSMEYYLMTHQWVTKEGNKDQKLLSGIDDILNGNVRIEPSGNATISPSGSKKNNSLKYILIGLCVFLLLGIIITVISLTGFLSNMKTGSTNTPSSANNSSAKKDSDDNDSDSASKDDDKEDDDSKVPDIEEVEYSLGQTVTFGKYLDEDIEWRVLKINEDGTLLLVSKYLLSMKTFDAPESGEYNFYDGQYYWGYEYKEVEDDSLAIMIRGNNDWSQSNIRTWLNSDKENVKYTDTAPTNTAVGPNAYFDEPGFLNEFSEDEKAAIIPVENTTKANSLAKDAKNGMITTTDTVFLLSEEDLELFDEADISVYAEPSEKCKEHDKNPEFYQYFHAEFGSDNYYWWLRDASDQGITYAATVVTEYEEGLLTAVGRVGICDYGVRPAICVDPSLIQIK